MARSLHRRAFLKRATLAAAGTGLAIRVNPAWGAEPGLEIGQAVVDTTPPLGIELAGFHRPVGSERLITGIRQPMAARAIVLRVKDQLAAVVSLDIIGVSADYARGVQKRIAEAVGIPADNVRICATHTHSSPTFLYLRQWGAMPQQYMAATADNIVKAVAMAKDDLSAAGFYVGKSRAEGGNFNRTTTTFKTDKDFAPDSTDADRWLDTTVHVLRFERSGKPDVLWYHFSAHPVCYTDGLAGPDWVGGVAELIRDKHHVVPAFLQGHAGDVNPGGGNPWLGDPGRTAAAVAAAIERAIGNSAQHNVKEMRLARTAFQAPLNIELLKQQLERYRTKPEECTAGEWVDAGFAKAWYEGAQKWDLSQTTAAAPMSAMLLGDVGLLFHPSELYSYYGLDIRRGAPMEHLLVVGYTDGVIGYLTDPKAYEAGEYAATTVPRIVDLPPFTPQAARQLAIDSKVLLKQLAGQPS